MAAAGGETSLQSLDRFISLVGSCPGLATVQCRGGVAGDMACTHLAALMLRRRHFASTAEAVAWTLIARPRLSQSVDLRLLEAQDPGGSRAGRPASKGLSMSASAQEGSPMARRSS